MHTSTSSNKQRSSGFTIVELLIVIVVIGILAAITVVAYNGIQQRAKTAALTSAVDQWEKIIRMGMLSDRFIPGNEFICLGDNIADFPEGDGFLAGECMSGSGFSYTYDSGALSVLEGPLPSGTLPKTTATVSGQPIKARGLTIGRMVDKVYWLFWIPQVSGQCGRGVDAAEIFTPGSPQAPGELAGGTCILTINL